MKLIQVLAVLFVSVLTLRLTHVRQVKGCCEYDKLGQYCLTVKEGSNKDCEPKAFCCDWKDSGEGNNCQAWVNSESDCNNSDESASSSSETQAVTVKVCCKWDNKEEGCLQFDDQNPNCTPEAYCCDWKSEIAEGIEDEYCDNNNWKFGTYQSC